MPWVSLWHKRSSHTNERDGVGCGRHDLCDQQHEYSERQQHSDTCKIDRQTALSVLLSNQYCGWVSSPESLCLPARNSVGVFGILINGHTQDEIYFDLCKRPAYAQTMNYFLTFCTCTRRKHFYTANNLYRTSSDPACVHVNTHFMPSCCLHLSSFTPSVLRVLQIEFNECFAGITVPIQSIQLNSQVQML